MQFNPITSSFSVSYTYKLHFTQQLFHNTNPLFASVLKEYKKDKRNKLLFVIDDGVSKNHLNLLNDIEEYCKTHSKTIEYMATVIIAGGERCKNEYTQVEQVLKGIHDHHIDRHSFVVAIGGGALLDMVGYASTIAHRGVKLIRIPTTVLSQNDSGVGVKNSINSFGKKNFLGTFSPPYAIINDTDFLQTLEQRDWISGISEALKVALIKDKDFFEYIESKAEELKTRHLPSIHYLIHKCAEIHMQHIAKGGDPFENGSSRPLDFGHWAAHKLEQMSKYELRHGEAVAKGIALDVTYAQLMGLISGKTLERILNVMQKIGFDLQIPVQTKTEMTDLLSGIQEFQEHLGGTLCITLIDGIGGKHDVNIIETDRMKAAVAKLNKICQTT